MNAAASKFPTTIQAGGVKFQTVDWGYVLKGSIHVTYGDGRTEKVTVGQVYHWPAGHTVRVDEDYESIEFSPSAPMNGVLARVSRKLKG
jgi:quercetin dioxygenase-like cupin family protein